MTKEEKQLLLKDLCARLPYGVKINVPHHYEDEDAITTLDAFWLHDIQHGRKEIKPYLRPMSSMTEEERKEHESFIFTHHHEWDGYSTSTRYVEAVETKRYIDWLITHHFDYYGLIPMGLALEAPEEMYKEIMI